MNPSAPHPGRPEPLWELIGTSPAMRALRERIARIARVDSNVLILGETGTGKGLVAQLLHRHSARRGAPFVHLDCAALCPSLAESEIFGHARGAFTGAAAARPGRCELAGSGVLFLDEIGEIGPPLQAKLLRVLQDRSFERVGEGFTRPLEARVLAATNLDLERAVTRGEFRRDLFYRLRVVEIALPPLRERADDIPLLAQHALAESSRRLGLAQPALAPSFHARLRAHRWPGNVRELRNAIECCLVEHAGTELRAEHLDAPLRSGAPAPGDPDSAAAPRLPAGARALLRVLRETGGNVSRAARRLGIPRSTLRYRIARWGLEPALPRD